MAKKVYVGIENFTKRNLPTDYTQIEYIEGNGSQYIDVNFQPNQNTRVRVDVELPTQSSYPTALFGGRNGDTSRSDSYTVWLISATQFQTDFDTEAVKPEIIPVGRFIVDKNKTVTTINGIEYTNTAATFQSNYNLALMTQIDVGGPDTRITAGKLYSAKVWDNDILIRDYVPCINIDGTAGLYDMVNNVFYSNAGTGAFVAGSSHRSVARKIKKGYVGIKNFIKRDLPTEYMQVEYIKSNGTQYIDTGFKPNQDTQVVLDFHNSGDYSGMTTGLCPLFGARNASSSAVFAMWIGETSYPHYGNVAYNKNGSFTTDLNARLIYDLNKNIANIDEDSITCTSATFTTDYNLCILTINNYGTIENRRVSGKLYSCRIYDNGILVRDYIPCVNSVGTAGLYDLVNDTFYTNAGTGIFEAGATYKEVANKIKKAYIGIGGIARPCWSDEELVYYGMITALSGARNSHAATSNANYALFAGGNFSSSGRTKTVEAYDKSLTKTTAADLARDTRDMCAASVGQYALIGAGMGGTSSSYSEMNAYNESLTKVNATSLTNGGAGKGSASISDYAIFAASWGGSGSTIKGTVDAYNTSLSKTQCTSLTQARYNLSGASVGNFALFAGGRGSLASNVYNIVEAYDLSLTQTTPTTLSQARYNLSSTNIGNFALFAGGRGSNSTYDTVDAYDSSLTRNTPTVLSQARQLLSATSIDNFALFAGGGTSTTTITPYATVDVYDKSLTRISILTLSSEKYNLAATSIGNYALFAGGTNGSTTYSTVDAFTIV